MMWWGGGAAAAAGWRRVVPGPGRLTLSDAEAEGLK